MDQDHFDGSKDDGTYGDCILVVKDSQPLTISAKFMISTNQYTTIAVFH
jgi:hypothetical protein